MNLWIKCSMDYKVVFLYTDIKSLAKIEKAISPYFEIELDVIPDLREWKIYISKPTIEMNEEWECISGESSSNLFYNRIYFFQKKTKSIYIKEPQNMELKIQTAVRLCRDIIKHKYDCEDMFFLHAGMVCYNGKGICIVGDKKAGKTSSILAILSAGKNAAYIANDDLSIIEEGERLIGNGWPRAISIRRDALESMQNILYTYKLSSLGTHPDNQIKGLAEYLYLYPTEIESLFSCEIKRKCIIDIIIFPHFSSTFKVIEMSSDEAYRQLELNLLKNKSKNFKNFEPEFESKEKELSILSSLQKVRCFHVYQNIFNMDLLREWVDSIDV